MNQIFGDFDLKFGIFPFLIPKTVFHSEVFPQKFHNLPEFARNIHSAEENYVYSLVKT